MSLTREDVQKQIDDSIDFQVQTSCPAVVTNVDQFPEKQFVRVRPLVNDVFEDYLFLQPPEIFSVPVVFPSAGGGILSFPIQVGDTVMLLFSKDSISEWLQGQGEQTTPNTFGKFALTDAVAIAGLYTSRSNLKPNPVDTELKFADNHIILRKSGDIDMKVVKNWNIDVGVPPEEGEESNPDAGITNLTTTNNINIFTDATVNLEAVKDLNVKVGTDESVGNVDITVSGSMTATVEGDVTLTGKSNCVADITGNARIMAGGTLDLSSGGNMTIASGGSLTLSAVGAVDIDGSIISLN